MTILHAQDMIIGQWSFFIHHVKALSLCSYNVDKHYIRLNALSMIKNRNFYCPCQDQEAQPRSPVGVDIKMAHASNELKTKQRKRPTYCSQLLCVKNELLIVGKAQHSHLQAQAFRDDSSLRDAEVGEVSGKGSENFSLSNMCVTLPTFRNKNSQVTDI